MVTTRRVTRSMSRMDPAAALGRDELRCVLSMLSAKELAVAALVSKQWQGLAYEERLWQRQCQELWAGKAYVSTAAQAGRRWRERYGASLADSTRTQLEAEELCSFCWTFRFKRQAGAYWLSMDPFWTRQGARLQRFFHPDGSITAGEGDPLWGEHEIRWRFTKSCGGIKGQYVRVNHWPALSIQRTEDWGWRMENCWVVYEAEACAGVAGGQ